MCLYAKCLCAKCVYVHKEYIHKELDVHSVLVEYQPVEVLDLGGRP